MNVSHKPLSSCLFLLALAISSGCYTAQLDPDIHGVFVCDVEDDAAACPASQTCVNQRCEDAEAVPVVSVIDPEDEESLTRDDLVEGIMGPPPIAQIEITVRIQGSIELVSASSGADPTFGEGYVTVSVDGQDQATLDSGSIGASTPVMVQVPAIVGAHRILVQAFRSDGVAYDNPEATATRLFWFERQDFQRPLVAIKSPWPGAVFGPEDELVEIELATRHFTLTEPGGGSREGQGHAHLFYDDRVKYPGCVQDPSCDGGYLGIAGGSQRGEITLPTSGSQSAILTAALRNSDHSPYGIPFGCDPSDPGPLDLCSPVFDAIQIVRVDD